MGEGGGGVGRSGEEGGGAGERINVVVSKVATQIGCLSCTRLTSCSFSFFRDLFFSSSCLARATSSAFLFRSFFSFSSVCLLTLPSPSPS